jgi:SAM-dependent methyltransferase
MEKTSARSRVDASDSVWARVVWEDDRMILDGQVFRLEEVGAAPDLAKGELRFFKQRAFVERLRDFFELRPGFQPQRILEMGIWEGGSVAFWNQVFRPRRHVAFDLAERADSPEFAAWAERHAVPGSVETIWGIDQSDRGVVLDLAIGSLAGPPDLIIDDAAHILECLQPAFETLFPLLRPGGIYLIEDWSWAHRPGAQADDHFWRPYGDPTTLIFELVEAIATSGDIVAAVHLDPDWVAIERGPGRIDDPLRFRVADSIVRRPARR